MLGPWRPRIFMGSWAGNAGAVDPIGFFGPYLDLNAVIRAIRYCGRSLAVGRGQTLHARLITLAIVGETYIANNLISMYTDFQLYDDAHRVFDEMPVRNVASWTASISAYTRAGNPSEALSVFGFMFDYGLEPPNSYTFSAALKACALARNLEFGRWIHRSVMGMQLHCDTVLMNAILDMYIKCDCLHEARHVFDGLNTANTASWNTMLAGYCGADCMDIAETLFHYIPQPDAVSYNTMIAGFAEMESPKALDYVSTMHTNFIKLDTFTFPCALKACGGLGFDKAGKQIHSYIIKCGSELNCFTGSSLIDMYANCGRIYDSMKLFDMYLSRKGPAFNMLPLMNSILSGFVVNRYDEQALDLVSEIHHSGIKLDSFTVSSTLKVCINLQNLRIGLQLHSYIVRNGYILHCVVRTVLIDLYANCGNLNDALRLFHGLKDKDVISWTGLIACCVRQGSYELAFSLFKEMIRAEVDHYVVSNVLKACSSLASLQGGAQIHCCTIKKGLESESTVVASLIDMYSKCGDVDDGLRVFEHSRERDAVCWTGTIVGCGYNGRSKEAMELFQQMLKLGLKPNEITFLGVLSACRHGGLVTEASRLFEAMEVEFGVKPSLEHYSCMIDILGRAGRFDVAKQLMSDMPYEANETIRNSMVGASAIHQTVDVGKFSSVECPTSIHDISEYVTLSNAYASVGMWDVSAKLREAMRRTCMKDAGKSWIAVRV